MTRPGHAPTMRSGHAVSINVGQPRPLHIGDREVVSGIVKQPVFGPVELGMRGFAGDGQADLTVHGGPDQAAYAYPAIHYAYWQERLGRSGLPWGYFGENVSLEGFDEASTAVGDVLRAGTARLQVTRPRGPCTKLEARVGVHGFAKQFLDSGRLGFYLRVLEPGVVAAGDAVSLESRPTSPLLMSELIAALFDASAPRALVERAAETPDLLLGVRERLEARLRAVR